MSETQSCGLLQPAHDVEILDRSSARAFAEIIEPGDEAGVPASFVSEDEQFHAVVSGGTLVQDNLTRNVSVAYGDYIRGRVM